MESLGMALGLMLSHGSGKLQAGDELQKHLAEDAVDGIHWRVSFWLLLG
jgi:hypothetical protein